MNKTELLEALEDSRQEMLEMIEELADETLMLPCVTGNWSIKDILAHLTYWEGQVVTLLFQLLRGVEKPTTALFGPEPVDEVNQRWCEEGKERSLEMVWKDWLGVRKQTIRRVEELSEKDLADPGRFPWAKGKPLTQWILDDSVEHEEEHCDQIREWLEARDAAPGKDNGNPRAG